MKIKKIHVVLIIFIFAIALVSLMFVGFFDFLGNEKNITDEFDYAEGVIYINDADEKNGIEVINFSKEESNGYNEYEMHSKDTTLHVRQQKAEDDPTYISNYNLSLNADLSDVSWLAISKNNESLKNKPVEKRLQGNLTKIITDSLNNDSDMKLKEFSLSYFFEGDNVPIYYDIYRESGNRKFDLEPKKIKIEDGKLIFNTTIRDSSQEFDLRQAKGSNAKVTLRLKSESSELELIMDMHIK